MAGWEMDRSAQLLASPWFLVLISVFRIDLKEHASMGTVSTNDSEGGCPTRPLLWPLCPVPSVGSKCHMEGRDWI